MDPSDYVLSGFSRREEPEVEAMVADAAAVVELWLTDREKAVELAARRGRDG
jgi:peptidyl-tRNA hydrolase